MGAIYGSSYYKIVDGPTWEESASNAVKNGGHLVTINTQAEDEFVEDFLESYFSGLNKISDGGQVYFSRNSEEQSSDVWIGLNDKANEGQYLWHSGEPVSYIETNELYDDNGIQDYVALRYVTAIKWGWDDQENTDTKNAQYGRANVRYSNKVGIVEIPLSYFSISDATFREGKGGDVTITRTGGTTTSQTLKIISSDGSATLSDDDYAQVNKTVTFAAGETSKTIKISTTADLNIESDESFSLTMTAEGSDDVPPQITDGSATVTIKADDYERGNSLYTIVDGPNWTQAETEAKSLGGNLITINNNAENTYVVNTIGSGHWIGFTDEGSEGNWKWSSGTNSLYTNWAASRAQPSNSSHPDDGRTQNHAWIHPHFSGEWDDYWNDIQGGLGLLPTSGIAEIPLGGTPTYSITPSTSSIDEKSQSSVRFNISTTNVDTNTRLYYTLSPLSGSEVTTSDFSSGNIKSSRLIGSDGKATFVLSATADKTTEGTESFNIKLYSDFQRTNLVATSSSVSIADTSTKAKTPSYSLSISPSSIDEGDAFRASVSTKNPIAKTRLYYTIKGDIDSNDFTSSLTGSILLNSKGTGSFTRRTTKDLLKEGSESAQVFLYSDSKRTLPVATSAKVTITDTSKGKQSAALLSASISTKTITLNFDASLSNTKPATQRFKVTADGKSIRVSSASLNADAGSLKLNLASAINPKQTVKLTYTDLKGDQSKGVLQTTDGTDLSSFSTAVSNNSSDSTAPTVTDATINGKALTLSFDEAIAKATPSNRSWTLKEDGKAISITSASVDSSSAQLDLTLSTAVDRGSNITLSYRDISGDQKANVIQDLAGNDLASFTNFSVENQTIRSSDPLDLNTAEINGNEIVLAFNRELSTTTPSTGTFRLRVNNKAIKVNSITLSPNDREAVLKIASPVAHGDNVTLSYTDAQGNQKSNVIEDVDGNDLATISNFKLTNNTRKSSEGFEVDYADADGKIINLYLTDSLSSSIPKAARFRVTADKRKQKIGSVSTSPSDGIIALSLKKSINPKQDILISYRDLKGDQRSGVAEDTDGNDLASFQNLSPINDTSSFDEITDNNPPSLEDAYLDGKELILEFDKSLQTGKVSPSRFKLRAGKKRVRVASAVVPKDDDSTAILMLKSQIPASANSLSLTYKDLRGDQSSNIIQDDSGNDLASLRNFSVEII
ncbi:SwmB domain-containing protein [Synechococcus sp. CC9902]|uniref:SwmB domain-containing protein n=1 Tax=Synechococcus sp. (strain CC9902) TaxID=316279 RepID=UPI0002D31623|nr:SwmB domain-containing protein [Synechococcus sp. CC9902]